MEEGMSGFCIKAGGACGGGSCCNGGRGGGGGGTKCGRWNPTEEQIKVLSDLFRSGLRTPTTEQIGKISSQLSFYGKIESKNVFYWFQNHKARERQKRRRVSVEYHNDLFDGADKVFTEKHDAGEVEEVSSEPERVVETLQLFPLKSYEEEEYSQNKLRFQLSRSEGINEMMRFSWAMEKDQIDHHHHHHHPHLDLRLSIV